MVEHQAINGKAVALPIDNLDTDQIMPKQFLRGIDKSGLAQGVLYDLRFDKAGVRNDDFVLNQPTSKGASILIGGSNFGCGSSREHAVWGLLQFGFKAVIASSFAEIFYSNAMGNRLLLVQLDKEDVEQLMVQVGRPDAPEVRIDIASKEVVFGDMRRSFPLSERHQSMFLQGADVIGMTLQFKDEIQAFANNHWAKQPWVRDVAKRMRELR